jgi:hypothetical protein
MTQIELKSRVGPDGVLALNVPVGTQDANREVIVTVRPSPTPPKMTRDEWLQFIKETAGAWQGEPFERPDQGEFEKREEWG